MPADAMTDLATLRRLAEGHDGAAERLRRVGEDDTARWHERTANALRSAAARLERAEAALRGIRDQEPHSNCDAGSMARWRMREIARAYFAEASAP